MMPAARVQRELRRMPIPRTWVHREREDVVEPLEVQRLEATSARHRAYEDLDTDLVNNVATSALSEAQQKRETSPRSSRPTAKDGSRVGAGFFARTIPPAGNRNREERSCTKRRSPCSGSARPPSHRRARRRSASRCRVEPKPC